MIITRMIFMVLSSRITVTIRIHAVHLMNADSAPHGRQTSDQANQLGLWVRQKLASTIRIHHRHLLLILSLQADTHFTVPQRDVRLSWPTDCSERAITLHCLCRNVQQTFSTNTLITQTPSDWPARWVVSAIARLESQVGFQCGRQRQMFHILAVKVLPDHETTQALQVQHQRNFVQTHPRHLTTPSQRRNLTVAAAPFSLCWYYALQINHWFNAIFNKHRAINTPID